MASAARESGNGRRSREENGKNEIQEIVSAHHGHEQWTVLPFAQQQTEDDECLSGSKIREQVAHFFMSMSGSKIREQVAHFLVDIHIIPRIQGKEFVNHKDGNKQNNSVENLEWVTRSENMNHAYAHGLKKPPIGIKNGRCKLSIENVNFIRKNYIPFDKRFGAKALSKIFNVSPQTISALISGQNWR